jgi:hypothetical protein
MTWRVGTKVPINVYEGDRPICQCHTAVDAKRIVAAMNASERAGPLGICQSLRPHHREYYHHDSPDCINWRVP